MSRDLFFIVLAIGNLIFYMTNGSRGRWVDPDTAFTAAVVVLTLVLLNATL